MSKQGEIDGRAESGGNGKEEKGEEVAEGGIGEGRS